MQSTRSVGGISSGLIGAAAAIATILAWNLFERSSSSEVQAMEQRHPTGAEKTQVVVQKVDTARLAQLERELEQLKAERAAESAKETAVDDAAEGMDAEESGRRFEMRLAELDQRHEEETADPQWAPEANIHLNSGLTDLGSEFDFSVDAAECKMTMCRASLSWSDYKAARKTGAALAERSLPGLNCIKAVSYPAPDDSAAAYSTELYLDCTDLRAGLVEPDPSNPID